MVIDVVIPTYNRAQTLRRALDSVAAQTIRPNSLLIVDDGSTDSTNKIVDDFNKTHPTLKTQYIYSKNKGVSHARNLGVSKSTADWIAFLDSDDEWLPKKLELQIDQIKTNPDLQIIHGEEIWIRNGIRVNPHKKHQKSGGSIYAKCLPLCCISPSTVVIKKSLLKEMEGFREDFPVCEDYDLWLKICAKYPVGFVEIPIINKHGGHEDQLSQKYFAMDFWRVKSLSEMLAKNQVPKYHISHAQNILRQKCDVLLKGYLKHKNLNDFETVQKVQRTVVGISESTNPLSAPTATSIP